LEIHGGQHGKMGHFGSGKEAKEGTKVSKKEGKEKPARGKARRGTWVRGDRKIELCVPRKTFCEKD